ncbi:3-methylitaconate isomerase [Lasiodiplodia theobromae]|uniref:3-methylitaconate isomerase n=1 Tax=Lasiodiplodia theobromae TaxID=45133 RepID=A0A5N5DFP3_9PEZI|nr:3-methylitaconate isomerase [Lasiodiplodia theobromae]
MALAPPNASSDVAWHLPQGSWETHVHVFDPRYPYSPERQYTPVSALYDELLDFNSNLSVADLPGNIVLVQPSPYGSDNSLILDLLRNHSLTQQSNLLRAITVIDPDNVTDEELHEMNALGVRGIRINTQAANSTETAEELRKNITAAVERVKGFNNWKCQLYISGDSWDYIHDLVRDLPIPVIADHQGGMGGLTKLANGSTDVTAQPGFASLLDLAKSGKVFVKISALYRSSKLTTGGYDDLEPLVKFFAQEVPQQLIWGSDWPHTGSNRTEATRYVPEPFRKIDNEAVLKNIRKWVGWDNIFRGVIGSPDPNGRQLDGMGGGLSSLSKVCVVGPSSREDADVDYTFVAIGVKNPEVDFSSNCGNMTSAVGPFAVDSGLFRAADGNATVRIHNTNTGKIIHAKFPVNGSEAEADGDLAIDGVAGTGAKIQLAFLNPSGSKTGKLLPTGNVTDKFDGITATCIDVGNPCVFVQASDLGVSGGILSHDIEAHPTLLGRLDSVRRKAAVAMGISTSEDAAPGSIPKIAMVSASHSHKILSGQSLDEDSLHHIENINSIVTDAYKNAGLQPARKILGLPANLLSPDVPALMLDAVKRDFGGKLDILVNNAAYDEFRPIGELDPDYVQRSLFGNIQTLVMSVDVLFREGVFQPNSRIVNISAELTRSPLPHNSFGLFAATKAAMESLTRTWADIFGKHPSMAGTTVNSLLVGATETDAFCKGLSPEMTKAVVDRIVGNTSLARLGKPEDAADLVGLLVSERAGWITGSVVAANGGAVKIL